MTYYQKKISNFSLIKIEIEKELEPSLTVKPNLKWQQKEIVGFLLFICGSFGVKWSKTVYLKQDNEQQMKLRFLYFITSGAHYQIIFNLAFPIPVDYLTLSEGMIN